MTRRVSHEEFHDIQQDVRMLRSLLIGMVGEDREGVYRPAFVRALLAASMEQPTRRFRNTKNFLDDLAGV